VQGRWALREPVSEVAEPDAIAKLFSTLAGVRIVDFLDSPAAAGGGTQGRGLGAEEQRTAVLVLESDLRDAGGSAGSVLRRTLEIGQTADLAGRNVYARVRQEVIGQSGAAVEFERVVVVAGEGLAGIAMDPATYISRRTFVVPATEVGGVVLKVGDRMRHYERTLDGWRVRIEDAAIPLERSDEEGLAALLNMVMQAPAARVRLAEAPADPAASVQVMTLGGSPIGEAVITADGAGGISVHSRGVERVHDAGGVRGARRWLEAQSHGG
jgi:hypothetical protein